MTSTVLGTCKALLFIDLGRI